MKARASQRSRSKPGAPNTAAGTATSGHKLPPLPPSKLNKPALPPIPTERPFPPRILSPKQRRRESPPGKDATQKGKVNTSLPGDKDSFPKGSLSPPHGMLPASLDEHIYANPQEEIVTSKPSQRGKVSTSLPRNKVSSAKGSLSPPPHGTLPASLDEHIYGNSLSENKEEDITSESDSDMEENYLNFSFQHVSMKKNKKAGRAYSESSSLGSEDGSTKPPVATPRSKKSFHGDIPPPIPARVRNSPSGPPLPPKPESIPKITKTPSSDDIIKPVKVAKSKSQENKATLSEPGRPLRPRKSEIKRAKDRARARGRSSQSHTLDDDIDGIDTMSLVSGRSSSSSNSYTSSKSAPTSPGRRQKQQQQQQQRRQRSNTGNNLLVPEEPLPPQLRRKSAGEKPVAAEKTAVVSAAATAAAAATAEKRATTAEKELLQNLNAQQVAGTFLKYVIESENPELLQALKSVISNQ